MKLGQTVDSNYKKTSDGDNSTNKNYRRRCFNQFAFQSLRPGYHRSVDRSVEALFYTWWVLTRINFFPLRLCFQPFNSRDLNHSVPIRLTFLLPLCHFQYCMYLKTDMTLLRILCNVFPSSFTVKCVACISKLF